MNFASAIAEQFNIKPLYAENVLKLIDDGNTIPFIARYRKEQHGALDDQVLREIADRYEYLMGLEKRRGEIRSLIVGMEKMTDELSCAIDAAQTLTELEDIYRPYRPKRKTRASVAREKGLAPLAEAIFAQEKNGEFPIDMAERYVDEEKGIATPEDALAGALDIIAEDISDDAELRKKIRFVASAQGLIRSRAADAERESVYKDYYDFSEPVSKIAGHRVLAINRGEKEGFLKVSLELDAARAYWVIEKHVMKQDSPSYEAVKAAAHDAYERLIFPSIEREIRTMITDSASENAIKVFALNLRQLLMQPPIKGKVTLGLDPGYRTGCKVAVVDSTGRVLDTSVIYCALEHNDKSEAKRKLKTLIKKHKVELIAIGNGTASKETEMFTAELLHELNADIGYVVVSEAGASVYSASKLAAEEFPQFDVSLRSAVSIARRLQDPLAELVKIEPKAIGVGQYQHDMPPKELDSALCGVVEDCVNSVGVDLNTASPSLLSKVAGISPAVSKNIVLYREENGAFTSRTQLLKVSKLGPKAYEQCAGFMRVPESKNLLDNTAVHPESYKAAEGLLKICGYDLTDLSKDGISQLRERAEKAGKEKIAQELGIGVPTLNDIIEELLKPGRDPRDELPKPLLRTDVLDINDLKEGMELDGTVRNVIDFGCFVDIGVHQDGLVHISQICDGYIKHPSERVKVGDIVRVRVLSVDAARKRISLSMKIE